MAVLCKKCKVKNVSSMSSAYCDDCGFKVFSSGNVSSKDKKDTQKKIINNK
jgi:hypothetical protein